MAATLPSCASTMRKNELKENDAFPDYFMPSISKSSKILILLIFQKKLHA